MPKCLLAYFCVKAGFRVFIGSFRAVHELSGHLQGALFFHKSTYKRRARAYKRRFAGHIAVLDEEMGIALKPEHLENIFRHRYADFQSGVYDTLFVLNESHRKILEACVDLGEAKVVASGWPRVDLWRAEFAPLFAPEAKELREEHGNFILFVSSFGVISSEAAKRVKREVVTAEDIDFIEASERAAASYIALLKWLDHRLNRTIVVRPHTGQSSHDWERLLKGCQNIRVVKEGDVAPWILAADSVLTYRSTVAVQAALWGKWVVQFGVTAHDGREVVPLYKVSECVDTREEVANLLSNPFFESPSDRAAKATEAVSAYLGSHSHSLATEVITNQLSLVHSYESDFPSIPGVLKLRSRIWHSLKKL